MGSKQNNMDTMKTNSQQRDYSLEDGGIFEKKTVIANTSIEEAKIGESLTQRSYEILAHGGPGSHSDIEKFEAHSQQEVKQRFIDTAHESVRRTNETLVHGMDKEEIISNQETEELVDDGEVQLNEEEEMVSPPQFH